MAKTIETTARELARGIVLRGDTRYVVKWDRPPTGVVVFRVFDHATRKPRAGATVLVDHPDGERRPHTADEQGAVRIPARPGERFRLVQLADGGRLSARAVERR